MTSFRYTTFVFDDDNSFTTKSDDHPQLNLSFKIRCTSHVSDWVVFQGTTPPQQQLLRRTSEPLFETSVLVNHDQFGCADEILDRELVSGLLPAHQRRELIDDLLYKAREMVECMPPDHNSAQVHFRVYLSHTNLIDGQRERVKLAMQQDSSSGMIPDEESSID